MPISTVSRRLSVLESVLGVSLVRRTTRRVTLTAQGREYFNQCQEPLTLLQEAERVLTQAQRKPEGTLRISVPVILGQEPFLDFLSGFLKDQALAKGSLVRLLPQWTSPQIPVFAVYPSRRFLPARLSVFLEALAAWKNPLWTRE